MPPLPPFVLRRLVSYTKAHRASRANWIIDDQTRNPIKSLGKGFILHLYRFNAVARHSHVGTHTHTHTHTYTHTQRRARLVQFFLLIAKFRIPTTDRGCPSTPTRQSSDRPRSIWRFTPLEKHRFQHRESGSFGSENVVARVLFSWNF